MEFGRTNQHSLRDVYPNVTGVSTSEYTQPESAEQTQLYDADGNADTIVNMRAGANQYSVMLAFGLLVGLVILGGYFGIR